jgi:hypothetical protein
MSKKVLLNEEMMNKWIDLVIVPWKNSKMPGVVPIIILDDYHAQMIGTIVNGILLLGIEVVHIPPSCV